MMNSANRDPLSASVARALVEEWRNIYDPEWINVPELQKERIREAIRKGQWEEAWGLIVYYELSRP